MLNEELFKSAIANFASYYGKNIVDNQLAYRAWYKHLSKHLNDKELNGALEIAIQEFEFFPSPQKVVEAAFGSQEVLAYEEWSLCVTEATYNGNLGKTLLSPQGEKALYSLGGMEKIKNADEKELTFLAKDFVRRWVMYARAIAAGLVEPPLPKLQAAPEPTPTEAPPATPEQWQEFKSRLNDLWRH